MGTEVRELTETEIEHVSGGTITTVTRNPQGHETQGQGQTQTTVSENPAGKPPPGQN